MYQQGVRWVGILLLVTAPLLVDGWFLKPPQYPNPPAGSNQKYQVSYVLVNSPFGSYIKMLFIPIQEATTSTTTSTTTTPTTTTTTTTTTTQLPPPPSPVIPPQTFFSYANYLPFETYNSYICGIFSSPLQYPQFRIKARSLSLRSPSWEMPTPLERFRELEEWLDRNRHRLNSKTKPTPQGKIRGRGFSLPPTTNHSLHDIIKELRYHLLTGVNDMQAQELEDIMRRNLNARDLVSICQFIYGVKYNLAQVAFDKLQVFYVDDVHTAEKNADNQNRLLIDLILAANGKAECRECALNFKDTWDIMEALYTRILPSGLPEPKAQEAIQGIRFLTSTKLSPSDAAHIMDNFVYDFINTVETKAKDEDGDEKEEDDNANESPLRRYVVSLLTSYATNKRSLYNQPCFDKEITCYILRNYESSSTYCGIRKITRNMYSYLQCSSFPSPLLTATTTTTTTTTITVPTTSSTTFQAPTTTETSTIPSLQTTTLTTTGTTTIVQCGVSEIAQRSTLAMSTSLFLTARIVGGVQVGTCTTWPWMVRLTIDNSQLCGGSILDETHILTAAHCVINKYSIKATVGDYDTTIVEGTEQAFDIDITTGISVHPEFSYFTRTNDLAVITLDKPIDFSEICASPICLDPGYIVQSSETCTVAGWGSIAEGSMRSSDSLQEVKVTVYQGEDCSTAFPSANPMYFTNPSYQLCAGDATTGGYDSCTGDSGGPLMCLDKSKSRWVVVGVVSYGEGCGQPAYPGVYSETAAYYDWITSHLV